MADSPDLSGWTLEQKLAEVSGSLPHVSGLWGMLWNYNAEPYAAGGDPELGVPELRFTDGPRGIACYQSTCFPVPMARGATWDPELEERVGDAMGVEARSHGANFVAAVCINALRHPGWGRAQETYGEDPHHLGELGAASTRGLQRHVMACAKHFACNSIENSRFRVDVRVDEATLRELYLPHFRRVVRQGVASVMSAYNKVNGTWCSGHRALLTDVLRGEWGFEGFVVSDFVFGTHSPHDLPAGQDLEMPLRLRFGRWLRSCIRRGTIDEADLDTAVGRIVATKRRFAAVGEPERYGPEAIAQPAHRALAREAATRSMVLLQNEPVHGAPLLPLRSDRVALIGRLAARDNIGDLGSSHVRAPSVSTILAALHARTELEYDDGSDLARAMDVAARRDVAVVVVGLDEQLEGESIPLKASGGDRWRLGLRGEDEALVRGVVQANRSTVVVLVGGSPITCEGWRHRVPALVMAWYPGMEGGHALADLLLGEAEFGGRLPCVWPADERQLPSFDPRAATADYSGLHGYRKLQDEGRAPAFPFGFGLSYTEFAYEGLQVSVEGDEVLAAVTVRNLGARPGDEVVQVYAGGRGVGRRSRWELRAFRRVSLAPGEAQPVRLSFPVEDLAAWRGAWTLEAGTYEVGVGPCCDEGRLLRASVAVG